MQGFNWKKNCSRSIPIIANVGGGAFLKGSNKSR